MTLRPRIVPVLFAACAVFAAPALVADEPVAEGEHHAAASTEPITPAAPGVSYGTAVTADGALAVADVLAKPELAGQSVKVSGKTDGVCTKMGCWMTIEAGEGRSLRVAMKDHAFFVPADILGCEVVAEGTYTIREQTVEELRHQAEDAGKSAAEIEAITEPRRINELEASGVLVVSR